MRVAEIIRKTNETDIKIKLNLDGEGKSEINTGCGFLDHMLTLFSAHGGFDLEIKCVGDINVDYHHTVEDIGICLGQAFNEALKDKRGITRYGSFILPMDEALILTAVDISGRSSLLYKLDIPTEKIGDFGSELIEEFLLSFTRNFPISLHIRRLEGKNSHHIAEGGFKSLARSLKIAVKNTGENSVPSTKGVL